MVAIEKLRSYYYNDNVFITNHDAERCRQRGILSSDIRYAVFNGEIIKEYLNDFPFPSYLILGWTKNKKPLHVCISDEGDFSKIITAYFPSPDKWEIDFKTRKEK